jgi:hypothetical protein
MVPVPELLSYNNMKSRSFRSYLPFSFLIFALDLCKTIQVLEHNLKFNTFQGLTLKSIKHHTALQPLFAVIGLGMVFVGAYIVR